MASLVQLRQIQSRLAAHLHRTPLWYSSTLSQMAGCRVYVKAELLQKTGSYKPRGMLWALQSLTPEQKAAGAITFSAGNAAQGLAYAGALTGVRTTVVMPATASPTKAAAARDYGAEVIQHGNAQQCLDHCLELVRARGLSFISSYDNDALMAGHATLGLEILDERPDAAAIYVGIGGGGMAGGLVKAADALGSRVQLVGVEPAGAPAMRRSLEAGHAIRLASVNTIADGLAAPTAGERCFELVRRRFAEILLVEDEAIVAAMRLLMARCKLFVEPAAAAALAGLLAQRGRWRPRDKVVVIASGGNVDFDRLRNIL